MGSRLAAAPQRSSASPFLFALSGLGYSLYWTVWTKASALVMGATPHGPGGRPIYGVSALVGFAAMIAGLLVGWWLARHTGARGGIALPHFGAALWVVVSVVLLQRVPSLSPGLAAVGVGVNVALVAALLALAASRFGRSGGGWLLAGLVGGWILAGRLPPQALTAMLLGSVACLIVSGVLAWMGVRRTAPNG